MAYRDRDWFVNALYAAKSRVKDLSTRIDGHIKTDEFDAAKMLLPDFANALTDANETANQFADKFGG